MPGCLRRPHVPEQVQVPGRNRRTYSTSVKNRAVFDLSKTVHSPASPDTTAISLPMRKVTNSATTRAAKRKLVRKPTLGKKLLKRHIKGIHTEVDISRRRRERHHRGYIKCDSLQEYAKSRRQKDRREIKIDEYISYLGRQESQVWPRPTRRIS
jgi:hypothetical protein